MEKLICSACGAPLTPDSTQPFLTCEYCDTAVENKYYVAPAVVKKEEQPAADVLTETEAETLNEETASGSSLLKTLVGVGTAIAANNLRKRTSTVHRVSAARPVMRTAHPSTPHRPPEPPHAGAMGARPVRAARPAQGGMSRPQPGRSGMHGGMRGPGGPGGRGGRGGMGGPGGRHR